MEILKKIWEFGGENWKFGEKSEILEGNLEIWEKFGNRKFFWK